MKKSFLFLFLFLFALPAKAENKDDFLKIYQTVQREYFGEFVPENFVINGIKGLSSIDKNIKVLNDGNLIRVFYGQEEKKHYVKPKNRDSLEDWAELAEKIMNESQSFSPLLSLHDYKLFDTMNEASFTTLDEYSKYFASLEDEDDEVKIRKYFGARQIDNFLYVKIKTFNKQTFLKLKNELTESNAEGLVLDLRGNRGGLLSEALKVADLFLEKGSVITSVMQKNAKTKQIYTAKKDDFWQEKPIVVIVDGDTASSAEMLSAALQDQDRATIIGTTTFGKGTVQNLKILSEDKGFSLTNARFYSPLGHEINKKGLRPDVCITPDCHQEQREKETSDIDAAISELKKAL